MSFVVRKPGERIKDNARRGYSVVLYGPPLVGKTTTLANDPSFKICEIDLDLNSTTIEESDNVTLSPCNEFEDYLAVKEGVNTGVLKYPGGELKMDFDLYVIDSFTTLEEKIKVWVAKNFAPNRSREIKGRFGAQTDWDDLQRTEVQEVRDWQAMTKRAVNPINVLWIGHDEVLKNDMGQAFATQLMLQGKYASPRIGSAVDAMFYMTKEIHNGQVYRPVYTLDHGIFKADARMAIERRDELPSKIWEPKWGEIFSILGYQK
jgi:hypothetical protein